MIVRMSTSHEATILIVDDEADVREGLEEYFATHGYAVVGAESASAARAIAARQSIDLALVDIHMPGEDGLSLARHLRERYASIAVVMLTSAARSSTASSASRWARTTTSRSPSTRASCWRA
jgi:DNA-binding response OmpR family regulator